MLIQYYYPLSSISNQIYILYNINYHKYYNYYKIIYLSYINTNYQNYIITLSIIS